MDRTPKEDDCCPKRKSMEPSSPVKTPSPRKIVLGIVDAANIKCTNANRKRRWDQGPEQSPPDRGQAKRYRPPLEETAPGGPDSEPFNEYESKGGQLHIKDSTQIMEIIHTAEAPMETSRPDPQPKHCEVIIAERYKKSGTILLVPDYGTDSDSDSESSKKSLDRRIDENREEKKEEENTRVKNEPPSRVEQDSSDDNSLFEGATSVNNKETLSDEAEDADKDSGDAIGQNSINMSTSTDNVDPAVMEIIFGIGNKQLTVSKTDEAYPSLESPGAVEIAEVRVNDEESGDTADDPEEEHCMDIEHAKRVVLGDEETIFEIGNKRAEEEEGRSFSLDSTEVVTVDPNKPLMSEETEEVVAQPRRPPDPEDTPEVVDGYCETVAENASEKRRDLDPEEDTAEPPSEPSDRLRASPAAESSENEEDVGGENSESVEPPPPSPPRQEDLERQIDVYIEDIERSRGYPEPDERKEIAALPDEGVRSPDRKGEPEDTDSITETPEDDLDREVDPDSEKKSESTVVDNNTAEDLPGDEEDGAAPQRGKPEDTTENEERDGVEEESSDLRVPESLEMETECSVGSLDSVGKDDDEEDTRQMDTDEKEIGEGVERDAGEANGMEIADEEMAVEEAEDDIGEAVAEEVDEAAGTEEDLERHSIEECRMDSPNPELEVESREAVHLSDPNSERDHKSSGSGVQTSDTISATAQSSDTTFESVEKSHRPASEGDQTSDSTSESVEAFQPSSEAPRKFNSTHESILQTSDSTSESVEVFDPMSECVPKSGPTSESAQTSDSTSESVEAFDPMSEIVRKFDQTSESVQTSDSTSENVQSSDSTSESAETFDPISEGVQKSGSTPEIIQLSDSTSESVEVFDPISETVRKSGPTPKCVQSSDSTSESVEALDPISESDRKSECTPISDSTSESVEALDPISESVPKSGSTSESTSESLEALDAISESDRKSECTRISDSTSESVDAFDPLSESVQKSGSISESTVESAEAYDPMSEIVRKSGPSSDSPQTSDSTSESVEAFDPVSESVQKTAPTSESTSDSVETFDPISENGRKSGPTSDSVQTSDSTSESVEAFYPISESVQKSGPTSDSMPESVEAFDPISERVQKSHPTTSKSVHISDSTSESIETFDPISESIIKSGPTSESVEASESTSGIIEVLDPISQGVQKSDPTTAESVQVSDSSQSVQISSSTSEIVEAFDQVSEKYRKSRPDHENVQTSDSMSEIVEAFDPISETVQESHQITSETVQISDSSSDSVEAFEPISESVQKSQPKSGSVQTSESMSEIVEAFDRISEKFRKSQPDQENVQASDSMSEIVDVFDPVSKTVQESHPITSETVHISDSTSESVEAFDPISESIQKSGSASEIVRTSESTPQSIEAFDTISENVEKSQSNSNSVQISDSVSEIVDEFDPISESVRTSGSSPECVGNVESTSDFTSETVETHKFAESVPAPETVRRETGNVSGDSQEGAGDGKQRDTGNGQRVNDTATAEPDLGEEDTGSGGNVAEDREELCTPMEADGPVPISILSDESLPLPPDNVFLGREPELPVPDDAEAFPMTEIETPPREVDLREMDTEDVRISGSVAAAPPQDVVPEPSALNVTEVSSNSTQFGSIELDTMCDDDLSLAAAAGDMMDAVTIEDDSSENREEPVSENVCIGLENMCSPTAMDTETMCGDSSCAMDQMVELKHEKSELILRENVFSGCDNILDEFEKDSLPEIIDNEGGVDDTVPEHGNGPLVGGSPTEGTVPYLLDDDRPLGAITETEKSEESPKEASEESENSAGEDTVDRVVVRDHVADIPADKLTEESENGLKKESAREIEKLSVEEDAEGGKVEPPKPEKESATNGAKQPAADKDNTATVRPAASKNIKSRDRFDDWMNHPELDLDLEVNCVTEEFGGRIEADKPREKAKVEQRETIGPLTGLSVERGKPEAFVRPKPERNTVPADRKSQDGVIVRESKEEEEVQQEGAAGNKKSRTSSENKKEQMATEAKDEPNTSSPSRMNLSQRPDPEDDSPEKEMADRLDEILSATVREINSMEVPLLATVDEPPAGFRPSPLPNSSAPHPPVRRHPGELPKLEPITLRIYKDNLTVRTEGPDSPKRTRSPKTNCSELKSQLSPLVNKNNRPSSPQSKQLEFTLKIAKDSATNYPKATMSPKSGLPSPAAGDPGTAAWKSSDFSRVEKILKESNVSITPIASAASDPSSPDPKMNKITLKLPKDGGHPEIKMKKAEVLLARSPNAELTIIRRDRTPESCSPPDKKPRIDGHYRTPAPPPPPPPRDVFQKPSDEVQIIKIVDTPPSSKRDSAVGTSSAEMITPVAKKRGRPRKIIPPMTPTIINTGAPNLEGMDDGSSPLFPVPLFDLTEGSLGDPGQDLDPLGHPSNRPMRSCRGRTKPIVMRTRKPRGGGILRGGGRGRGIKRQLEADMEALSAYELAELAKIEARREKLKADRIAKKEAKKAKVLAKKLKDEERRKRIAREKAEAQALQVFEEETRMSAPESSRAQTPGNAAAGRVNLSGNNATNDAVGDIKEESQGSVSNTPTSNHNKKGRMEIPLDLECKEVRVDQLAEYQWQGSELHMIQEQISLYLGVKSFKRKYPNLKRRAVEAEERTFLEESGLVPKSMCDLGLTAVSSAEVCDVMFHDFPDKYEEFRKHVREKQAREASNKQKAALANSFRKDDRFKVEPREQAIESAAVWNANLNKERREDRRCALDLQTFNIHYPKSRHPSMTRPTPRVGNYPAALLPGQFCDYYKQYKSAELMYFPVNTVLYGPLRPNERHRVFGPSEASQSESDRSSSSSEDSSDCSSDGSGDEGGNNERENVSKCKVCSGNSKTNKEGQPEVLIQCAQCSSTIHPTCQDLTVEMVPHIKKYDWQCTDCKNCIRCKDPANEDKMLFCDLCDRGYHIYCVGLNKVPEGRWHCTECSVCSSCQTKDPGGPEWQHEYKKGEKGTKTYMRTLCVGCSRLWKKGKYCQLCLKCHTLKPEEEPGLQQCNTCDRWIHKECINPKAGQLANKLLDNGFQCGMCQERVQTAISNSSAANNTATPNNGHRPFGKL